MDLLEAIQIAGLCVMVAAAAFLVWYSAKTFRQAGYRRSADPHDGWRLDAFMGVIWTAMLLVQLPSIARHLPPPATTHLSWLSWSSIASVIFICGAAAGRLMLRLELRRYEARRDEQNGGALTS